MVRLNFSIGDDFAKELREVADKYYHGDRSDALRKGIALLKVARQAHERGEHIGSSADVTKLDAHWVGIF